MSKKMVPDSAHQRHGEEIEFKRFKKLVPPADATPRLSRRRSQSVTEGKRAYLTDWKPSKRLFTPFAVGSFSQPDPSPVVARPTGRKRPAGEWAADSGNLIAHSTAPRASEPRTTGRRAASTEPRRCADAVFDINPALTSRRRITAPHSRAEIRPVFQCDDVPLNLRPMMRPRERCTPNDGKNELPARPTPSKRMKFGPVSPHPFSPEAGAGAGHAPFFSCPFATPERSPGAAIVCASTPPMSAGRRRIDPQYTEPRFDKGRRHVPPAESKPAGQGKRQFHREPTTL